MTLPIPHSISPPTGGTYDGCAYWQDHDKLLVANQGDGKIYALSAISNTSISPKPVTVVGTGYNTPSDIMLSADGNTAYISERVGGGNLLRVPLSNLNRAAATVIASGLGNGSINQIGLDETHGYAFVAVAGNLVRINLSTNSPSAVASGLDTSNTSGVLASRDGRYVYVSNRSSNTIVRYDLAAGTNTVVASGLNYPQHMLWSDAGETAILFIQGSSPAGLLRKLDLTIPAPLVSDIAGPVGDSARGLALCSPGHLLISCHREIDEVFLTPYASTGPLLLGIGFVPVDTMHIVDGYATTTMDPDYFFQVRDAPFGGTLPIMINFNLARDSQARYYKVLAGPAGHEVASVQGYSDYRWNTALDRFELVTTMPAGGFYPVRDAGEIWLNYWLGMLLSTGSQPNGLVSIIIELYDKNKELIKAVPVKKRSVTLTIDNTGPTVGFLQINQVVTPLPKMTTRPVRTCDVVMTGNPWFTFTITASQAQQHLAGWSLVAYWGENRSATVAGDSYSNHISPSHRWAGITTPTAVPPPPVLPNPWWDATVAGDPTSTRCAHTFWLYAWDRVINGWGYVHGGAGYHKSVTIWL